MTSPLRPAPEPAGEDGAQAAARHAKHRVRELVAGDRRVNGVGITRWKSRYAVRVNVLDDVDVPELPDSVDGVPVRVVCVGRIGTQQA